MYAPYNTCPCFAAWCVVSETVPPPFLPARSNSCSYSFSGYFPIGLLGRLLVLAELGSATVFFGLPFSGDERTKGSNGPRIPSAMMGILSLSEFVGAFTSVHKVY